MRRILAIDGGGIKGVIPAAFLSAVEQATGKRIVDHFDLVAGTSTGGIIALGLGLGLTATEILEFYQKDGPRIFAQDRADKPSSVGKAISFLKNKARGARQILLPKYDSNALRSSLERVFINRSLGESQTRLLVPAFDRQRREIHVFKTAHHPRFGIDWKERAVDVALATAAAPTYLPGHQLESGVSLLDGGIWANNPMGLAVVEAISTLEWPREELLVLSIGCSEEAIPIPENSGYLGLALKMADVFMLGQSRGAHGTAKLLTGHSDHDPRVFRYQPITAKGEFCLDRTDRIEALKGVGANMAREAIPQIQNFFLTTQREDFVPFHPSRKSC